MQAWAAQAANDAAGDKAVQDAQAAAPVFDALVEYQSRGIAGLHTPAHKGSAAPEGLEQFLTSAGLACDLPSLDATDYLSHPRGCVAEAQRLAARLYGAAETFYLVNGSTVGVHTMLLAALAPGEKVLLSRDFHISAFAALVLSGAEPVYLPSRWLETGGPLPPDVAEVDAALRQHPDIRAVFVTQPSYYGVGRPLAAIAELCHRRGIPLLVDEAHGAHLRFLPSGHLRPALDAGADVVVQSVHKTVGSLVGTAQLHRGDGGMIAAERLQAALNLLHTTSPNYLLLASLDLTRRQMWRDGRLLFAGAFERALDLRQHLAAIDGIVPFDVATSSVFAGCAGDPLRLVVDVAGLGLIGFDVERRLRDEFSILCEFCDRRNVTFVLGPPDTADIYDRLVRAFRKFSAERGSASRAPADVVREVAAPPVALTPREAASRSVRRVPLRAARDRICGEIVTMYPPGIPLACPGEILTQGVIDACAAMAAAPACVLAGDPTLTTVAVIDTDARLPRSACPFP